MTQTEFNSIMDTNPFITAQGIGVRNSPADYPAERLKAYDLFDEANICEYWLAQCPSTKTIRKKLGSSRDFADKFQDWEWKKSGKFVSLPVGALLIAVIHLQFQYEQIEIYPGFYLNISNRWKVNGEWICGECL
jgi:hypothetical protein